MACHMHLSLVSSRLLWSRQYDILSPFAVRQPLLQPLSSPRSFFAPDLFAVVDPLPLFSAALPQQTKPQSLAVAYLTPAPSVAWLVVH